MTTKVHNELICGMSVKLLMYCFTNTCIVSCETKAGNTKGRIPSNYNQQKAKTQNRPGNSCWASNTVKTNIETNQLASRENYIKKLRKERIFQEILCRPKPVHFIMKQLRVGTRWKK